MVNGADISPEKARKMRAWLARHESDKDGEGFYPGQRGFPSPGRVAWALWAGDAGVTWSNKLVNQMDKIDDEKKSFKEVDKRLLIWKRFIEKQHGPAEKEIQNAFNEYFKQALKRYVARIRKESKSYNTKSVNKGIDFATILETVSERIRLTKFLKGTPDKIVNGRLIKGNPGAFQGVWDKNGKLSLRRLLKMGKVKPPGNNIIFGEEDYLDELLDKSTREITTVTSKKLQRKISDALLEGQTLTEIANDLSENGRDGPIFGRNRAITIARTESTRLISGAQNRSFAKAETEYGLTVKKAWVANRDDKTRELHLDLEQKYGNDNQAIPQNEDFIIADYKAQGPGLFGDGSMDINCRCSVIPIVT